MIEGVLISAQANQELPYAKTAMYTLKSEMTTNAITVRRTFLMGDIVFTKEEFPQLRAFYTKLETKDQEPVVLRAGAAAASE